MSAVQATPGAYARARVRDLDQAIVQALNRARALDYQLPRARVRELAAALADDLRRVRLLAAEFDAELEELATAAASRWSQVGHASRVAGRVWFLRRALLARTPAADRV